MCLTGCLKSGRAQIAGELWAYSLESRRISFSQYARADLQWLKLQYRGHTHGLHGVLFNVNRVKRHVLLFDKLISAIPPRREVVQKRPIFLTLERATLAVLSYADL